MNDLYEQALEALDELAEEKKIAFELRAFTRLELADFPNYYKLEFWDSPISEAVVFWEPGPESFKASVLDAVERAIGADN